MIAAARCCRPMMSFRGNVHASNGITAFAQKVTAVTPLTVPVGSALPVRLHLIGYPMNPRMRNEKHTKLQISV
ncbi:hypothetical protein CPB84DRAFT_1761742 [Gymnopilus junonius]|uniref:Uncharacterized protein n=1 Tax=Gymnopilus junonius TaxID=109634 RepID=A0A9P5P1B6_GYMJU|nr:hypothetical protein CPB84DRAFT_1761742 [Gymnopilus junonius]